MRWVILQWLRHASHASHAAFLHFLFIILSDSLRFFFGFFFFHHLEREYIASANCSSSNFLWLDSYNLKRNTHLSLLLYHYIRITLVADLIAAASGARFLLAGYPIAFVTDTNKPEVFHSKPWVWSQRIGKYTGGYNVCHILRAPGQQKWTFRSTAPYKLYKLIIFDQQNY